ncbi:MAG: hypothetical protein ABR921_01640 [Candidatus Sulfotelmatobacter sp.]|jgi:hypothetical protein
MQRLIRYYKEQTGKTEINMHEVAQFAVDQGWPLPRPIAAIDRLAKEFSKAAREEIRHDEKTGKPYRANHAFLTSQGSMQSTLWVDIDEAPRKPMLKSLVQRREQMVGDGLQLTLDAMHWNSIHPKDEPIDLPLDLGPDVEWRINAPDEEEKKAS